MSRADRRRAAALRALIAVGAMPGLARACPCQGSSGPAAAVTTQSDHVGVSVSESATFAHGRFLSDGDYAPLPASASEWAFEVTALAGYRPVPRLEVGAQLGFGKESSTLDSFSTERTGLGDTVLHARWEAVDEALPFEASPWTPALTLIAGLRAPTATDGESTTATSGTTGAAGATPASGGLGTWEPSLAAAVVKSLDAWWQVSFLLEGGYRVPREWRGHDRALGPRWLAEVWVRRALSPSSGVGVSSAFGGEGDVRFDGSVRGDSDQRLWSVALFGYLKTAPRGLRVGALARWAPPVDGVGKNATAATTLGVSLGASR